MARNGLDRRSLLSLGGTVLAASSIPGAGAQAGARPASDTRRVRITEGTNIAVTAAPDGRSVALDLFGVIWTVPVAGGPARRLTDDLTDGAQPDWTPDSKVLVFQSYRDGNFHIWSVRADGSGLSQLTRGPFDCREPRVSPDGRSVAFSSDATGSYAIHTIPIDGGAPTLWAQADGQAAQPCWSPDGRSIAFVVDRARIEVVDQAGARRVDTRLGASGELHSPSFAPHGAGLAYVAIEDGTVQIRGPGGAEVAGEDVFPFRPTWLPDGDMIYAANGKIRRRGKAGVSDIPFSVTVPVSRPQYAKKGRDFDSAARRPVVGIGSPALSPDGGKVVFRALNALWTMTVGDRPHVLVRDSFWKCDPAWSPDGSTLAYSTDKGGSMQIWLRDLATGAERQLTRLH